MRWPNGLDYLAHGDATRRGQDMHAGKHRREATNIEKDRRIVARRRRGRVFQGHQTRHHSRISRQLGDVLCVRANARVPPLRGLFRAQHNQLEQRTFIKFKKLTPDLYIFLIGNLF